MSSDPLDLSILPEELRHLGPLIEKYAESDDAKRSDLLANASANELQTLNAASEPHWDAINTFLDANVESEPGPAQDVALALDSFGQTAMEARFELESRNSR